MGDEPAQSGGPSEPQSASAKNEPVSNPTAASNAPGAAASAQAPKVDSKQPNPIYCLDFYLRVVNLPKPIFLRSCNSNETYCMHMQKPADKAAKPTDLKSLNVRQYLEATVVQVLMKGMQVRLLPSLPHVCLTGMCR